MKRFSILLLVLVLMSSIVMAVEPWETTDDAWQELPRTIYDEQEFGDKYTFWDRLKNIGLFAFIEQDEYLVTASGFTAETTWRDLGNMKYGYYADPTSFTGYRTTTPPTNDYQQIGDKYEVLLGNACAVGDYVAVLYSNSWDSSPSQWAFANFYYKAFSGDAIRATQYWIGDMEKATISYRCYSADITTIEYMCLSGKIYQDNFFMTSCDSNECAVYKFASETQYTNTQIEDKLCEPVVQVTCYQCDGTDIVSQTFDNSCGTGWSTTPQNCNNPVTCYQCSEGQVASQVFQNTCGTGWSTTAPSVCPVTCYSCDDGDLISNQYANGCPVGTSTTRPASCDVPVVPCYQCQDGENGVVLSELLPSCTGDWTSKELTRNDCSGGCNIICQLTEFYNEYPIQFWIITISILGIVVALVLSYKPKPKKPQGVVRL